jgi:hypothetical protein
MVNVEIILLPAKGALSLLLVSITGSEDSMRGCTVRQESSSWMAAREAKPCALLPPWYCAGVMFSDRNRRFVCLTMPTSWSKVPIVDLTRTGEAFSSDVWLDRVFVSLRHPSLVFSYVPGTLPPRVPPLAVSTARSDILVMVPLILCFVVQGWRACLLCPRSIA